jgi:hypothetical protein
MIEKEQRNHLSSNALTLFLDSILLVGEECSLPAPLGIDLRGLELAEMSETKVNHHKPLQD